MLNLLIVDDEPIAVNYLVGALMEEESLEANILKAYSSAEALEQMAKSVVDILLTDICMPGMDGMELAEQVRKRWPRCKIIFLTGYNDFAFAQTAIRTGGIDYVLKTEGDESILRAIRRAMDEIAGEMSHEGLLERARSQLKSVLPALQKEYLLRLFQGEAESEEARLRRFSELEIQLEPDCPVWAAVGRIDDWGSFADSMAQPLLFYALDNIAEEYYSGFARFKGIQTDRSGFVWLVQLAREEAMDEESRRRCSGNAEQIQEACKRMLKVPVSLSVASSSCGWSELGQKIQMLRLRLSCGMDKGKEMFLTEPVHPHKEEQPSSKQFFAGNELRTHLRRLDLLENDLDEGNTASCRTFFTGLQTLLGSSPGIGGSLIKEEIFCSVSAFFLQYISKRDTAGSVSHAVNRDKLANLGQHEDLGAAIGYFGELAQLLAEGNSRRQSQGTNDIISRINQYIHTYMHEELSLARLSELVYLNSFYLSRLYKQKTGKGLLEYINEARINRAKQLLKTTDSKIQEIATMVGLESAPYFTRLFKKITGLTPHEYRES